MASYLGRVIRILDKFTIIVSREDYSVSVGDTVQIYEMSDKITGLYGEDLGEFVYVKDELDVIQVEEKYCVCKKEKKIKKANTMAFAISPLIENTHIEKVPLKVKLEDINPLPELNKTLSIGDKVRKI